ncbi:hypothetical protein [Leptothermofonsia sichuanensis]|nr:hypothetical protein [Leptothermofonsia sichuanensis]
MVFRKVMGWAFGCLLWSAETGANLFPGDMVAFSYDRILLLWRC